GVVPFGDDVAVDVGLARHHLDEAGLAVDLDAGVGLVTFGVAISGQQRRLDGLDHHVDRDALVGLDGMQCRHVDVHAEASFPGWPASSSSRWFGGENSTWTTALVIPSTGSSRTAKLALAPSRTTSCTVPSRISPSRPVSCEPSDRVKSTLRPRARRECFSVVSGRSTPGEVPLWT